jgi:dTDP-4-dehydrorhamnose 3,5-epimerase
VTLEAARKDGQSVTPKGAMLGQDRIDGVRIAEINPVLTRSGATIEIFRTDGPFEGFQMEQVNFCPLRPNHMSDWHMHRSQTDVIIPVAGEVQIGLYDDRDGSPTKGSSLMIRISPRRMRVVLVPCGVWHALKNESNEEGAYVVLTDRKYVHADPDDWRLKRDEPALHGIL